MTPAKIVQPITRYVASFRHLDARELLGMHPKHLAYFAYRLARASALARLEVATNFAKRVHSGMPIREALSRAREESRMGWGAMGL